MTPSAFFQFQTLSDLRGLAARSGPAVRARIAALVPGKGTADDLGRVIDARGCLLEPGDPDDLFDALLLAATLPSEDGDAFAAATAVLLADRVQGGAGTDDLWHHWDTLLDAYAALPPVARSAISRGFLVAHARGRVLLEPLPDRASLLTHTPERVRADLAVLAHTLGPEDMDAVSRADYGREQTDHAAALRALMETSDALLPAIEDRWFPGEVVELVSHVPGKPGFAQCTAVILIEAIHRGDPQDNAAYRWQSIGAAYADLPEAQRRPILAGYRALCEGNPAWDPYFDWTGGEIARSGVAIPLPCD